MLLILRKSKSEQVLEYKLESPFHHVSQIFLWCLTFAITILFHMLLPRIFVGFEYRYLLAIHVLCHLISLPFLECKSKTLVAIVFVICLVFMVLDSDEIAVHGFGIKGERHECVDGGCLGNNFESPRLNEVSTQFVCGDGSEVPARS